MYDNIFQTSMFTIHSQSFPSYSYQIGTTEENIPWVWQEGEGNPTMAPHILLLSAMNGKTFPKASTPHPAMKQEGNKFYLVNFIRMMICLTLDKASTN